MPDENTNPKQAMSNGASPPASSLDSDLAPDAASSAPVPMLLRSQPMSLAEFLQYSSVPDQPFADWYDTAFMSSSIDEQPAAKGTVGLYHPTFGRVEHRGEELEVLVETAVDTETIALLAILYSMEGRPVRRAALYKQALLYGFPSIVQAMFGETMKDDYEAERWKTRFDQLAVLAEIGVVHIDHINEPSNGGSAASSTVQDGHGGHNQVNGRDHSDHSIVAYDVNPPVLQEIKVVRTSFDGFVEDFSRHFPIVNAKNYAVEPSG